MVIGSTVYCLNYIDYPLPRFIRFYVNDLLIVPIAASTSLYLMRWIFKVKNLVLSVAEIVFVVVFFSGLFELVLPYFHTRYTGDWYDVMMYVLGGLFYWKYMNVPARPSAINKYN